MFSFFEELAEPLQKVAAKGWEARGKLVQDISSYSRLLIWTAISIPGRVVKVVSDPKLWEFVQNQDDPESLAFVVIGAGGALCLGSAGACMGCTVGGVTGLAVGIVPALLTFGLSIPIGAVIGCVGGGVTGATIFGSAGFIGGGACGHGVAMFREDIRRCLLYTSVCCHDAYIFLIARPVDKVRATSRAVGDRVQRTRESADAKARATAGATKAILADKRFQCGAAGAGTGAAALGTGGAVIGTVVGGATGALVGVIPAFFTFGLSIPIGAAIGGSAGFCTGAVAGTTTGFVAGGAAGTIAYTWRDSPGHVFHYIGIAGKSAKRFTSDAMQVASTTLFGAEPVPGA
jgi:hypothetical protein